MSTCPPFAAITNDNRLRNCPIVLADFFPACGQNFFQMVNISNSLPVDKLLKHSPDQIVYGIQIRTVRWTIFWFNKVWNVSNEKNHCKSLLGNVFARQ